LEIYQSAY